VEVRDASVSAAELPGRPASSRSPPFAYIDGWYNTRRIQAGLGGRSPDEYEAAWYTANIDQPDPPGTTLEPAGAR
jgi:hypothetical protein